MARIRSVKPEVRTSFTVGEWPREVRLAWIYLWGYLDDHGRGVDDMRLVAAECFPLDRDVTERKMDRWLQMMATTKTAEDEEPPLCRYQIEGRGFMHAVKWHSHQKINRLQPSRIPPCPIHGCRECPDMSGSLRGSVSDSRSDSLNGAVSDSLPSRAPADQGRDQGRDQGTRDARSSAKPSDPDLFDAFWDAYPKKVAKLAARRRWDTLIRRGTDPNEIIVGAIAYAREKRGTDPQFVKQPDGWLNAGRWQDEPTLPAVPVERARPKTEW